MTRRRLRPLANVTVASAALATLALPSCEPRRAPLGGAATGAALRYEVTAGPGARELSVVADFPGGGSDELAIDERTAPFVRDVEFDVGTAWTRAEAHGASWRTSGCVVHGCRVRYEFELGDAAAQLRDPQEAAALGATLEAPPSSWLMLPTRVATQGVFRFHVTTPPGIEFLSGVWPSAGSPGTYEGAALDLNDTPFSAFGPFHPRAVDGAPVSLVISRGAAQAHVTDDAMVAWATNAARAVTAFYGRFPVPRLPIFASVVDGDRIDEGVTMGGGGAAIVIDVGDRTTDRTFANDWELTHEMVHTALPGLLRPQHWLEEGLATYVEPLARARLGLITPAQAWGGFVNGMPQGEPEAGDEGLDRTPTWGRTYWGGAMFCLLADVAIRERTGNRRSLDDALRAIVSAGGNISVAWPLERVLAVGDAAVGVPVLRDLHDRLGRTAVHEDLDRLFARLGVRAAGDEAAFDESAPLAAIRRSMTARLEAK